MGQIQVKIPGQGSREFMIEGEEPTQEESLAIRQYISNNTSNADSFLESSKLQSSLGPSSEPEEYQDSFISMSPDREAYDKDVDYSSGIKNQGFRLAFSNLNNDRERELYLDKKLGPRGEFWDTDKGGRFILTTQGRQKLGNTGEGKIAIDEEGLSWTDVTDFVGEAGLPILGSILGTIGAITLAPVAAPLLAASAGAGIGAGLFSLGDEAQQAARGVSDEDATDIATRAALEGVLAGTGELAGGILFNGIRRLVKKTGGAETGIIDDVILGRGTSEEGIKRSEKLKDLVDSGYTPDLTAEGLQNRPILGVNIKVFESIFPGRIDDNAKVLEDRVTKNLFGGREEYLDVDELGKMVEAWEKGKINIGNEMVEVARDDIKNYLTSAYDNILQKVQTEGLDPSQAAKQLSEVQQAFHKTMDDTFEAIDLDMGRANSILNSINLEEVLGELNQKAFFKTSVSPTGGPVGPAFIAPTNFKMLLQETLDQSGAELSDIKNGIVKKILEPDPEKGGISNLTLRQANAIRSYINSFDAEKAITGDTSTFGLGKLREALDDDISIAGNKIRDINSSLRSKSRRGKNKQLQEAFEIMEKSVDDLDVAQTNYKNFMEHQDDASIRSIVRSIADKKANPGDYVNVLLDSPTQMAKFLSALRKAKGSEGLKNIQGNLVEPPKFTKGEAATLESLANRLGKNPEQLVEEVTVKMQTPGGVVTQDEVAIKNIIQKSQERLENFNSFGRTMTDTLPEIENKSIELFQKKFLQNAIEKSKVDGKFNVQKFAQYIDNFNSKPRVAKGLKEGTAEGGFIDPEFENKTFFEMLFPEGKGAELIESVTKLNRKISDKQINDFSFLADDLFVNTPNPNAGSKDIDQLISKLKEGEELTEAFTGPQSAKMSDIAENQTGTQALRYVAGRSPGEQVEYFRAADKHINKLKEIGSPEAEEFERFRNNLRDLILAKFINKASANGTDSVFNVLDGRKLKQIISDGGKIAGFSSSELDKIFSPGLDFTKMKINGKQPSGFLDALNLLSEEADLVSSLGGAKVAQGVGLQAASAKVNASQGLLSGNRNQAWNGLSKIARSLVMARTLQNPKVMKILLTPPESLAQMNKGRVVIRDAFIQSLNQALRSGGEAVVDTVEETSRSLATPKESEKEVEVEEEVTRRPSIDEDAERFSVSAPRRTIPTPQQISLDGPAQQMSANIGNVERDIALGAAGNNPTMQALLRARGQA